MYSLPAFNLLCDIYTEPAHTLRVTSPCNLAYGRRRQAVDAAASLASGAISFCMTLLLPALTDIRDDLTGVAATADAVECPSGSGRFYFVVWVDDIGKGFPNEHRAALIARNGSFPVPIP
jgi:hypothetical protein